MSKVGKALYNVTDDVMKAGGVVTKNTGKVLGEVGKTMGVPEEKCNKMEQAANRIGEEMYYEGREAGNKVEDTTEEMLHATKKAYHSVTNKFKA